MFNMRATQPGFSLTEIIIAIMIIGVMAGATLGLFSWLGKAKRSTTEALMRTLKTNIDQYHLDTGSFPSSLKDLSERPSDPIIAKKWKGYLDQEIVQDKWGNEFQYAVNPKGKKPPYELYSFGPNGEGSPEEEWIHAENL